MLGEWFNTVALFVLIYTLTGSELGIGLLFVIRMFSLAVPQIFTGMLADRFSRKWLMIWANLLSAGAVLLLLLVDELPSNAMGKVQKPAIKKLFCDGELPG